MKHLDKFLWITPFLSFTGGYLLLNLIHNNKTVKAPSLIGQNIEKAVVVLSENNLNIRIIARKDEPDLPQGTILSQTPAAGKAIKEHQALYVVIAQKPVDSIIPNLAGNPVDSAAHMAAQKGFQLRVCPMPIEGQENTCIAQLPEPGTQSADKNLIVYAAVPSTKPVIMPNVKNQPLDEVISFLALNGIEPLILASPQAQEQGVDTTGTRIVVDQRPLPGSVITLAKDKPLQVQLQVGYAQ